MPIWPMPAVQMAEEKKTSTSIATAVSMAIELSKLVTNVTPAVLKAPGPGPDGRGPPPRICCRPAELMRKTLKRPLHPSPITKDLTEVKIPTKINEFPMIMLDSKTFQ